MADSRAAGRFTPGGCCDETVVQRIRPSSRTKTDTFAETVDTAGGVEETLLAGVKRMAVGTNSRHGLTPWWTGLSS